MATALLPLTASLVPLLLVRGVQGNGWGLATTAIASLVAVPGLLLGAAGVVGTGLARGPLSLAAAAVLYGVGMAGLTFPALVAWTVDRAGEARGTAMAAFCGAYDLAIALGAIALGPLYERHGFAALNLAGAAGVVAASLLAVAFSGATGRRRPDIGNPEPPRAR